MASLMYRRALLKLSGQAFPSIQNPKGGMDLWSEVVTRIESAQKAGAQLAVVVGAGNVVRGREMVQWNLISRKSADVCGMLGTIMNGLMLREALIERSCPVLLQSAIPVPGFVPAYSAPQSLDALRQGCVVICAGGTGRPFLSTDTASALLALELEADVLLKATKVDGVYSADPVKDPSAVKIESISAREVLSQRLGFMDLTAVSLCGEHGLPVAVFSMLAEDAIRKVLTGDPLGSFVQPFSAD